VRSVPLIIAEEEEAEEEEGNERSFIPDVSGVRCMKLISVSLSLHVVVGERRDRSNQKSPPPPIHHTKAGN